MIFVTGFS
jgi:hypothetical protein